MCGQYLVPGYNHRGEPCPLKLGLLCQEGLCIGCAIYLSLEKQAKDLPEAVAEQIARRRAVASARVAGQRMEQGVAGVPRCILEEFGNRC